MCVVYLSPTRGTFYNLKPFRKFVLESMHLSFRTINVSYVELKNHYPENAQLFMVFTKCILQMSYTLLH